MATSTSQFSISRATPTPPPASGTQRPDPVFSPGASPPLILAFLAIGLFAVSMIGVFGWRRIQYGRLVAAGHDPTWLEINVIDTTRRDIGPRPKLWDKWTTILNPSGAKGQAHEREMEWEAIMPVAVMANRPSNNQTTADAGRDGSSSTSRMWSPIASIPVRYYQWIRPERSTTPTSTDTTGSAAASKQATAQQESGTPDAGRLQVVVAIAMPSRRTIPGDNDTYGDDRREGNGHGTETDDTLEYTLGVYECAWKHENG